MKRDLKDRNDLELLINLFYEKINKDEQLAKYFTHLDWKKHLPKMYDFWENAIFYTGGYLGNPLEIHQNYHRIAPFSKDLFGKWIEIFNTSVDELFVGDKAALIKQKALSIATVMEIKIVNN
jgi:hemoglobin